MKQHRTLLAIFLTLVLLLTACGAKSEAPENSWEDAPAEEPMYESMAENEEAPAPDLDFNTSAQDSTGSMDVEQVEAYSDKIIYSGYVYLETTAFDDALLALDRACREAGGFVQDSEINGYTRYNDDGTTTVTDRWARYVVRVPAKSFDAFMAQTQGIGNVTRSSRNAENVTSQYTDHESRLLSLRTQEERLLAMLEESGDLESLITLEERLAEVRYEIETIERSLRNLDQQLAFSTVTLELQEVEIYTPSQTAQLTFGERLNRAFHQGWENFAWSAQNFAVGVVRNLPTLLILVLIAGAIAVLVVLLCRRSRKRKAQQPMPSSQGPVAQVRGPVQQPEAAGKKEEHK